MRKTATITIEDPGRDHGKTFVIREMPASQAEKWAARAFSALARSNVEIPANIAGAGLAGIAVLGFKALANANFADIEPLLDEMFQCVSIRPDPRHPEVVRPLIDDDIEEIATRLRLRVEVFTLHTGFFIPGVSSSSEPTILTPTAIPMPNTKTSPRPSVRSSPQAKRR